MMFDSLKTALLTRVDSGETTVAYTAAIALSSLIALFFLPRLSTMSTQCVFRLLYDYLIRLVRQTYNRQHHCKQQRRQQQRGCFVQQVHCTTIMRNGQFWRRRRLTSSQNWCHTLRQTVSRQASNIRIGANLHSAHACYVYFTLPLISYALFCLQINTFTVSANSRTASGGGGGGAGRIASPPIYLWAEWRQLFPFLSHSYLPCSFFVTALLTSYCSYSTHKHMESDTQKSPTRCLSRNEHFQFT